MDYAEAALKMHRENHGKLEMASKIPLTTRDELSTAYSILSADHSATARAN